MLFYPLVHCYGHDQVVRLLRHKYFVTVLKHYFFLLPLLEHSLQLLVFIIEQCCQLFSSRRLSVNNRFDFTNFVFPSCNKYATSALVTALAMCCFAFINACSTCAIAAFCSSSVASLFDLIKLIL